MDECVAVAVAEAEAVAVAVTEAVAEADQSIHEQSIHEPTGGYIWIISGHLFIFSGHCSDIF